jgi:hypothetical protein
VIGALQIGLERSRLAIGFHGRGEIAVLEITIALLDQ